MKYLRLLAAAVLLASAPLQAQERANTASITPLSYCQLTSISSATLISTCSGGVPALSEWALICVESAAIRWRDDGTNPTTSVGMPVASGACFNYSGTFAKLALIAQTGSPIVDISFYSQAPRT